MRKPNWILCKCGEKMIKDDEDITGYREKEIYYYCPICHRSATKVIKYGRRTVIERYEADE